MGHMFLILMDAHSKWMDAYPVTASTSAITIECLRKSFSNQGIPETIVSDDGSCFVSAELKEFLAKNGIEHITSAPYHASPNGCVERAVQTFKSVMKRQVRAASPLKCQECCLIIASLRSPPPGCHQRECCKKES